MIISKEMDTSLGRVRYLDSEGNGKPFIYIHGGFGDAGPIYLLSRIFDSQYRFVAPFLPGHGSFNLTPQTSYDDVSNTLGEFVDNLNLGGRIIMGHSFGGRLAWDLAAHKAILINPVLKPLTNFPQTVVNLMRDWKADIGLHHGDPEFTQNTFPDRIRNIFEIWQLMTKLPVADYPPFASSVLAIIAQQDSVLNVKENVIAASKYANVNICMPRGGHYWPARKGNTMQEVKDFLLA